MFKRTTLIIVFSAILCSLLIVQVNSFPSGAPSGRTGAPGDQTCQNSCHNTFALNEGPGSASITSDIPVEGYTPGETYTITMEVAEDGIPRFGFEALAYGETVEDGVGTVTLTEPARTQTDANGNREYVTHTQSGITSANSNTWTFDWTAPEEGTGNVTFYAAFVAGSGDNGNKQDFVYTATSPAVEKVATNIRQQTQISFNAYVQAEELIINASQEAPEPVEVRVLSLQGTQVFQRAELAQAGEWETRISAVNWTPGVYLVQVIKGQKASTQRVLVR